MGNQLPHRVTRGTAGRILELLRRGPCTVEDLTTALELTPSAVRAQLGSLEHDGLVEPRIYGVTAQAELLFSRAYVPILTQLLHVLVRRMPPDEFDALMREVARGTMSGRVLPRGPLRDRVGNASSLLNELGGLTEVNEETGFYVIQSHGCPLAVATADHPEVCNVLESILSEFVGATVMKCCDRYDRLRCCFEIARDLETSAEIRS